jgi:hypothetical protein
MTGKKWRQELFKKTSKPAGNTARNKKGYDNSLFYFDATKLRACGIRSMSRARSFIFRERIGGNGGKERAIGPFFSPVAFFLFYFILYY